MSKTSSPAPRSRAFKGADGDGLSFTESDDRSGWIVTVRDAAGVEAQTWISKGEGRTFARFLQVRPQQKGT
jgi:hypothetical protein